MKRSRYSDHFLSIQQSWLIWPITERELKRESTRNGSIGSEGIEFEVAHTVTFHSIESSENTLSKYVCAMFIRSLYSTHLSRVAFDLNFTANWNILVSSDESKTADAQRTCAKADYTTSNPYVTSFIMEHCPFIVHTLMKANELMSGCECELKVSLRVCWNASYRFCHAQYSGVNNNHLVNEPHSMDNGHGYVMSIRLHHGRWKEFDSFRRCFSWTVRLCVWVSVFLLSLIIS